MSDGNTGAPQGQQPVSVFSGQKYDSNQNTVTHYKAGRGISNGTAKKKAKKSAKKKKAC